MLSHELFNTEVLKMTVEDLIEEIDSLLDDVAPEGKSRKDFTGGYVQQLSNSNQLVAYFGTKEGTNNRHSVKITVEADELDEMYMMLKAKIHDIRKDKTKTVKVSMAQRRLAKKKLVKPKSITYKSCHCGSDLDDDGSCPVCSERH